MDSLRKHDKKNCARKKQKEKVQEIHKRNTNKKNCFNIS